MVSRPIRILVDSTADIPPDLSAELDITVVPGLVHFGQETFRDGVDLSSEEFYTRLETAPVHPTTSSPGVGVFAAAYQELVSAGADVVSIHPEATFSGLYNTAVLAAREITEGRVAVLDSHQVTMGTGWLAILAARAGRKGASLDEIVALVEEACDQVHLVALLDTVEPLQKSGRLGILSTLVGTLLRIKPIFAIHMGQPALLERPRTFRKARVRLLERIRELAPFQELAVMHTAIWDEARALADDLADVYSRDRILVAQAGAAMSTHVGPRAIAAVGLVARDVEPGA
jgi:DegV family protein with EDD domain